MFRTTVSVAIFTTTLRFRSSSTTPAQGARADVRPSSPLNRKLSMRQNPRAGV
jgi:hypothetical protein